MFKRWISIAAVILMGGLAIASASAAVRVTTVQAGETYGIDNVLLENDFLKAVVSPHEGGRIISLVDKKSGRELVHWDGKLKQGGLLSLIPGNEVYPGTLAGQPCTFEIVQPGPTAGMVRLSSQGDSQSTRGLEIVRDISLGEQSKELDIKLSVRNSGFSPREMKLRVHNWVAIGSDEARHNMAVLTARGTVYEPKKPITDFVDGAMTLSAGAHEPGGLKGTASYDQLASKMFWPMQDSCTMEWAYAPVQLAAGAVWQTRITFEPIDGPLSAVQAGPISIPAKHPPQPKIERRAHQAIATTPAAAAANTKKVKRILVLSQWDFGNASWADDKAFPEIAAYVKPMPGSGYNYQYYFGQIIYSQRWAFHARDNFQYFLRGDPDYQVDIAYESDFLQRLQHLYDYDVLVVNDFPAGALQPYLSDLQDYVTSGRSIVFVGGYQAFGGRGRDFGNWRAIQSLLPVEILTTPDWIRQTPFQETQWSSDIDSLRRRAMARPDPYGAPVSLRRIGPIVTCANFWHDSEWTWMRHGKVVTSADPLDPITAGLDWGAIAPDYHRVKAKEKTRVLAQVGADPILVSREEGKGRVLAVMLSDERKLYFWPGSGRFFRQIADWCTKQDQPVLNVTAAAGTVHVAAHNPTGAPVEGTLHLRITGDGFSVLLDRSEALTVAPGSTARPEFAWDGAAGAKKTIEVEWAGRYAALTLRESPKKTAGLSFNFHNRHVYIHGEEISVDVSRAGELTVRDRGGRVMWKQTLTTPGTIQIPTSDWALGEYALGLTDGTLVDAERFELVHRPNETAPIIWGGGPPIYAAEDSFLMMASLQRIAEYGATAVPVGSFNTHAYGAADYALKLGMRAIVRSGQASYYPPLEESSRQKMSELFEKLGKPYAQYPAVNSIYVDDEGTSYYWKDWDKRPSGALEAAFEKQYQRPLRQVPKTREEMLDLARFFDQTYNQLMGECHRLVKGLRDDMKMSYVISPYHTGLLGSYVPGDFEQASRNEIDVYPTSVTGLGEDLFNFSMLATLGRYNDKPSFVWPSEYRNRPDSIRMQAWAAMLSGINGWRWYAFGDGERTGVYRREVVETIPPLDRLARSIGPVMHQWRTERPRIAVVYPRETLAVIDPQGKKMPWEPGGDRKALVGPYAGYGSDYHQSLEALFVQLARHGLTADVLSSADLAAGRLKNYDAAIIAYTDQWLAPTTEGVKQFAAQGGQVLRWPSKKYDTKDVLPTAVTLDDATMKHLSERLPPFVATGDPAVIGRLLRSGQDGRFVALYNHNSRPTDAHVRLSGPALASCAVDAASHEIFDVGSEGKLKVSLGAYDGRVLQLLADRPQALSVQADVQSIRIRLPSGRRGGAMVQVTVDSPQGPSWTDRYWIGTGGIELPLELGINAPTGRWTVTVTDVWTGQTQKQSFTMKGGQL